MIAVTLLKKISQCDNRNYIVKNKTILPFNFYIHNFLLTCDTTLTSSLRIIFVPFLPLLPSLPPIFISPQLWPHHSTAHLSFPHTSIYSHSTFSLSNLTLVSTLLQWLILVAQPQECGVQYQKGSSFTWPCWPCNLGMQVSMWSPEPPSTWASARSCSRCTGTLSPSSSSSLSLIF